jgi:hypothetical protein
MPVRRSLGHALSAHWPDQVSCQACEKGASSVSANRLHGFGRVMFKPRHNFVSVSADLSRLYRIGVTPWICIPWL